MIACGRADPNEARLLEINVLLAPSSGHVDHGRASEWLDEDDHGAVDVLTDNSEQPGPHPQLARNPSPVSPTEAIKLLRSE